MKEVGWPSKLSPPNDKVAYWHMEGPTDEFLPLLDPGASCASSPEERMDTLNACLSTFRKYRISI